MLDARRADYLDFRDACRTVTIATVTPEGEPFISTAPFVIHKGAVHVYLSRICEHYHHLADSGRAHIMLQAEESGARNVFARDRVRFPCTVEILPDSLAQVPVFSKFDAAFGSHLMTRLRSFDFSLFRLTPGTGRYVGDFGHAFDTDLDARTFTEVHLGNRRTELATPA